MKRKTLKISIFLIVTLFVITFVVVKEKNKKRVYQDHHASLTEDIDKNLPERVFGIKIGGDSSSVAYLDNYRMGAFGDGRICQKINLFDTEFDYATVKFKYNSIQQVVFVKENGASHTEVDRLIKRIAEYYDVELKHSEYAWLELTNITQGITLTVNCYRNNIELSMKTRFEIILGNPL